MAATQSPLQSQPFRCLELCWVLCISQWCTTEFQPDTIPERPPPFLHYHFYITQATRQSWVAISSQLCPYTCWVVPLCHQKPRIWTTWSNSQHGILHEVRLQLFVEWKPYSLNLKSVCSVKSPVSLGFFIWRTTNWGSEPCSDCEYPTLSYHTGWIFGFIPQKRLAGLEQVQPKMEDHPGSAHQVLAGVLGDCQTRHLTCSFLISFHVPAKETNVTTSLGSLQSQHD